MREAFGAYDWEWMPPKIGPGEAETCRSDEHLKGTAREFFRGFHFALDKKRLVEKSAVLVRFLRSSFLVAIISLLVFAGYGFGFMGDCCSAKQQGQEQGGAYFLAQHHPGESDHCHCVCHQITPLVVVELERTVTVRLGASDSLVLPDEVPPDAVPLGIEHPPQLA